MSNNQNDFDKDKELKSSRRLWGKFTALAAFLIIALFFVIGLLIPARPAYSEVEKRELQVFPEFTAKGLLDGSYFNDITTWYADTYPGRENMISLMSKVKKVYGFGETLIVNQTMTADEIPDTDSVTVAPTLDIPTTEPEESERTEEVSQAMSVPEEQTSSESSPESQAEALPEVQETEDGTITEEPEAVGSIYIADGTGFSIFYFYQPNMDYYASMINTVRQQLPESVELVCMPSPNSFGVLLPSSTQKKLGGGDVASAVDYLFARIDPSVKKINVMDTLINHNGEYIYFRTDHHWTQLGAYYAYTKFCEDMGFEAHSLDEYERRVTSEDWLGSLYSYSGQSAELIPSADDIICYVPISTNETTIIQNDGSSWTHPIISDATNYDVFIGSDQPLEVIDNPDINDGSAILLCKDSYGNSFTPFLVDHYDKVFVADYRDYKGSLSKLIEDNNIQTVLISNNVEFLLESTSKSVLQMFAFGS